MSVYRRWDNWLKDQRAASTMAVDIVPLTDMLGAEGEKDWGMVDGNVGRHKRDFWRLAGAHVRAIAREVSGWFQPLIEVLGGPGAVVLVFDPTDGTFLIQARQEPGFKTKEGFIALGPTLQASRANLDASHGGKRPPRAELLDGREIEWVKILQDGGIFSGKINDYAILRLSKQEVGMRNQNERWFKRSELKEAFFAGECGEHLAQVLPIILF